MTEEKPIIALFIFNLEGGGAERVAVHLANGLAAEGKRVHLVLAQKGGPYLAQVDTRVEIIDLARQRMRYMIWPLMQYFRCHKPTVMLSFMTPANLVAIVARGLSLHGCRLVLSEHSTLSQVLEKGKLNALYRTLLRIFYAKADALVSVSQAAAQDVQKALRLPTGLTHCIYNPVVSDVLDAQKNMALPVPHAAFFDVPVVVAAGRMGKEKNFTLLLEAFAHARQEVSTKLLVLGEGPLRGKLEAQIKELGIGADVLMPGFVANPYMYFSKSAAYVLSSDYEGLPTVLIEALACGTPVIATDCPSGPDEILQGGKYGVLTPMCDVPALAAAIVDVVKNPKKYRAQAEKFQHEAMEQYTVAYATREYLKLLLP